MAAVLDVAESSQVWGTFDRVRDHLFEQFKDVPYVPETGSSKESLQQVVEGFLVEYSDMPRVLQKAHAYRLAVTHGQICVDPEDWFVDKLNHGGVVRSIREGWYREAKAGAIQQEADWFNKGWDLGIVKGLLDMGHISPGWENMFAHGLTGLLEKARKAKAALGDSVTAEQEAFYEAIEIVYGATIELSERFAKLAEGMIAANPEHSVRLKAIAKTCRQVPAHEPRTFYEALQFAWIMHEVIEMDGENVRSMGHFDRTMYPYYKADIEAGRLTSDRAQELIQFFWFKFFARTQGAQNGKNFVFAGQYADGSDVTNELTYLALDAYEVLNSPDPKLSVRFLPNTPDRLYRRVADLIRNGHNSFVLMNDIPAVEALMKRGKTPEDARTYLPIGCYEPAVDGKEVGCTMNLVINLAKGVELALGNGVDPLSGEQAGPKTGDPRGFETFEDLFNAYKVQMGFLITRSVKYVGMHEKHWPEINPSPLIAGTIEGCLERGLDIGQGGAIYNSVGCVGAGLANACDSLLALKQTVFDDKRFTMAEMLDLLTRDFEGEESVRQFLLNRVPKWGNNDEDADVMAKYVANHYCDKVHSLSNARGGPVQAALFTLKYQWTMGKNTGALPDGRKARASLACGVGATSGRDKNGVTGLIGSVSKLDFSETPNGSVLDVTLHPTAVRGEEGLHALVSLIKTFFKEGGYALQFNVFDEDMLRDAQEHPEDYASLQVRVTGWSVYFNTMSKFEQDQYINRIAHSL